MNATFHKNKLWSSVFKLPGTIKRDKSIIYFCFVLTGPRPMRLENEKLFTFDNLKLDKGIFIYYFQMKIGWGGSCQKSK